MEYERLSIDVQYSFDRELVIICWTEKIYIDGDKYGKDIFRF